LIKQSGAGGVPALCGFAFVAALPRGGTASTACNADEH
jgi:hypothetical protein